MGLTLKTAVRDVRVSVREAHASAPALRPQGALAPASEFAEAIQRRYAGAASAWPGLDFVLRLSLPGVTLQNLYYQTTTTLAPRLELTVAHYAAPSHSAADNAPLAPAPRLRQERAWPVPPASTLRLETQVVTETLLRRLSARSERVEAPSVSAPPAAAQRSEAAPADAPGNAAPASSRAAAITAAGEPPALPAVPKIVRRQAPANVEASAQAAAPTPATETRPDSARPRLSQAPAGAAPIDVNRLTEQVIRAIDRRLIAQRERLGRV